MLVSAVVCHAGVVLARRVVLRYSESGMAATSCRG